MPKLIAKEKFYYAGRNVEAGEEFEAEIGDVAILTHATSPKARQPEAEVRAPRITRTRVLKAATPSAVQDGEQHQTDPSRYNRADMRAED